MLERNVEAFFEKVEENKSLKAKLMALDKMEDKNSAIGEMVEIAKAEGFVFTPQDLKNVRSKQPKTLQGAKQAAPSAFADCTIEWPDCVEPNASCVIADPSPPPPHCSNNADLLCSFGGHEEQNM